MSIFLKDLPCRNPKNFTQTHATTSDASRQIKVRPTYTARIDSDVKEIINDPIPLIVRHLSRLSKDQSQVPEVENGSNSRMTRPDSAEFSRTEFKSLKRMSDRTEPNRYFFIRFGLFQAPSSSLTTDLAKSTTSNFLEHQQKEEIV